MKKVVLLLITLILLNVRYAIADSIETIKDDVVRLIVEGSSSQEVVLSQEVSLQNGDTPASTLIRSLGSRVKYSMKKSSIYIESI